MLIAEIVLRVEMMTLGAVLTGIPVPDRRQNPECNLHRQ